ncbi:MAG: DUF86 domain-containing protein [Spirulinaceae cyanobacterium]
MSDDKIYLQDILERIERIEAYTQAGKAAFLESLLIQDGVMRCFEIMGEAVKQLSMELRDTYPDIPWRRIAGFRDVLIHDYMGIELEEVWNVVERNLPAIKPQIVYILHELESICE